MKYGMIGIFPPARSALELMRTAERLEFDTFWLTDSHVIWNECYSHLGWLSAQLSGDRLMLGTMVTNPISRDPIVVASALATLQDLSGGRILCGIGRGDSSVRVLKRHPATVQAFGRAVGMIRSLTAGEEVELDGIGVRMPWATGGTVPLYVAAYGPRMLHLAGKVGDGVIIECADPSYIAWALERVHGGAREAGRDPAELAVISTTATFVSDDLEAARAQVRPFGAMVGNHIAEVLANSGPGSLPPHLEAFICGREGYDYQHHIQRDGKQAEYVPDEIIDRLCIVGPPEHCRQRIHELSALGVTHVNFYAQTEEFEGQMEIWAREVIAQTRGEQPRVSPCEKVAPQPADRPR